MTLVVSSIGNDILPHKSRGKTKKNEAKNEARINQALAVLGFSSWTDLEIGILIKFRNMIK